MFNHEDMETKKFHRLVGNDSNYEIAFKKPFQRVGTLKTETIKTCLDFSYRMTFGNEGEHRNHRSGGSIFRNKDQIFMDTFQGKLSEFAFSNIVYKKSGKITPDLSVSKLGTWDAFDFKIDNRKFCIKSTKFIGNLLLLETKDWDISGNYLPSTDINKTYDAIVMIRISPDVQKTLKTHLKNFLNEVNFRNFIDRITRVEWSYDSPGFITNQDFQYILKQKFIIPKGATLNGKTKMDAENYYVQAGDLRPIEELLEMLS